MLAGTEFASGFTLITPESVFSSNLTGKSMVAVSFESKQGARRAQVIFEGSDGPDTPILVHIIVL